MMEAIIFLVAGEPVPKQSTRFDGRGPTTWNDERVALEGDPVPQAAAKLLFPTLDSTLEWSD